MARFGLLFDCCNTAKIVVGEDDGVDDGVDGGVDGGVDAVSFKLERRRANKIVPRV